MLPPQFLQPNQQFVFLFSTLSRGEKRLHGSSHQTDKLLIGPQLCEHVIPLLFQVAEFFDLMVKLINWLCRRFQTSLYKYRCAISGGYYTPNSSY